MKEYKIASTAKPNLGTYSQNTFARLIYFHHVEMILNKGLLWLAFQQNIFDCFLKNDG